MTTISVWADWDGLSQTRLLGTLHCSRILHSPPKYYLPITFFIVKKSSNIIIIVTFSL